MERKEYVKKWKEKNRDKTRAHWKKWYTNLKLAVFTQVGRGNIACTRCGSTKTSWLEVNHINGGGRKEYKSKSGVGLYRAIANGTRQTDDLEILCRPCNMVHAAETMSGRKYVIEL